MAGVLVQNGKASFVDANGRPLSGGKVYFYAVGTNTPKDSFQDDQLTILNTNPVILNARGEASIYGSGAYRQVLRDASDVLIWDQVVPDLAAVVNAALGQIITDVANLYANSGYVVNGVVEMLAMDTAKFKNAFIKGYYSLIAAPGTPALGGGPMYWDPTCPKTNHNGGTIFSPTVPWNGAKNTIPAFLAGTGETDPLGSGCWVRLATDIDITMFGAVPVAGYNNVDSIQKAMDVAKVVYIPFGTFEYTGTLNYNNDGTHLIGYDMKLSLLKCLNTSLPAIKNPLSATVTRLFCGIQNLQLVSLVNNGTIVIDWKSFQFGKISKVWVLGQSIGGCTLINLAAQWAVTECTYNLIEDCYLGLHATGISIGDGANNNNIIRNRLQTSFAGGIGILLSATSVGRISVVNIKGNGFEFPGNISTGINVLQNCFSVHCHDNRFESLLNGIVVGAVGNKDITGISRTSNYFESCTTPLNLSSGATAAKGDVVAAGLFNGTSSAVIGQPFGLTYARTGAGTYVFLYTDTAYPDSSQVIAVTVTTSKYSLTQSATGFTIVTQNDAGVTADSAIVSVTVTYNR